MKAFHSVKYWLYLNAIIITTMCNIDFSLTPHTYKRPTNNRNFELALSDYKSIKKVYMNIIYLVN